jgi:hypothetical protein
MNLTGTDTDWSEKIKTAWVGLLYVYLNDDAHGDP